MSSSIGGHIPASNLTRFEKWQKVRPCPTWTLAAATSRQDQGIPLPIKQQGSSLWAKWVQFDDAHTATLTRFKCPDMSRLSSDCPGLHSLTRCDMVFDDMLRTSWDMLKTWGSSKASDFSTPWRKAKSTTQALNEDKSRARTWWPKKSKTFCKVPSGSWAERKSGRMLVHSSNCTSGSKMPL